MFILKSRTAADFSFLFLYFPPMNICFLCYQKNNNNETKVTSMWQLTLSKSFTWICVKLLWLPTSLSTESGSHGYQPILALGVDPKTKVNHPAWDSLEWKCNRVATAAKSLQSCPTLCDPMDCSPPGSSDHGIFQARILGWVVNPGIEPGSLALQADF